ncbi:hypothetical protein ACCO45_004793 [Purpureocillium lilacinum]|uniref:Uncharacterized protein n=1 Tax=Purpureocillium lilacinum TaxID=33203 RepID=A0ACC4DTT7_PURLI
MSSVNQTKPTGAHRREALRARQGRQGYRGYRSSLEKRPDRGKPRSDQNRNKTIRSGGPATCLLSFDHNHSIWHAYSLLEIILYAHYIMKASFAVVAGVAGMASAHMNMASPACIGRSDNVHTGKEFKKDDEINAPLDPKGSDYPCKVPNFASIDVTPPEETWQRGASYPIGLDNHVTHGGGSCQFALSKDRGKTATVIASYIGNCAANLADRNFTVAIPCDTPEGEWLFMWSWHNRIGNREMYQRCAYLNIKGGDCGQNCRASAPLATASTPASGPPASPGHCHANRKRHGHRRKHLAKRASYNAPPSASTPAAPGSAPSSAPPATGPPKQSKYDAEKCACVPFEGRPSIFIANINDRSNSSAEGLCTNEGTDVLYPDPGPPECVEMTSSNPYPPGQGNQCQWKQEGALEKESGNKPGNAQPGNTPPAGVPGSPPPGTGSPPPATDPSSQQPGDPTNSNDLYEEPGSFPGTESPPPGTNAESGQWPPDGSYPEPNNGIDNGGYWKWKEL